MTTIRNTHPVSLALAALALALTAGSAHADEVGTDRTADNATCMVMKDGFAWNDCGDDPYERTKIDIPGAAAIGDGAKDGPVPDPAPSWPLGDLFGPAEDVGTHPGDEFSGGGDGPGR